MKQQRREKKKPRKRNQSRNITDGWSVSPNASWSLPRTVTNIIPDRMMTRLAYKGVATFTIPASSQHFARRWLPSAAYDLDPLLGSTTVVGYNELAALYNRYRVVRSRMIARFANTSGTPVVCVLLPLNADPGSSPSLATVEAWQNNPYAATKLCPTTGAPPVALSRSMSTEKINGSKMVYFDDNYTALINAIPVNNWYWGVTVIASSAVASATGIVVETEIFIDVEFYNRTILLA